MVASDLAALRVVGGDAVRYCPVGDVEHWRETVATLLTERREAPAQSEVRRAHARRRAAQFTWQAFAASMAGVYLSLTESRRSLKVAV